MRTGDSYTLMARSSPLDFPSLNFKHTRFLKALFSSVFPKFKREVRFLCVGRCEGGHALQAGTEKEEKKNFWMMQESLSKRAAIARSMFKTENFSASIRTASEQNLNSI